MTRRADTHVEPMAGGAAGAARYRADAPACARDQAASQPEVVFYQLTRKFVDSEASIPDESADVMYYALAIGHHTGVIDCFEEKLRVPLECYAAGVARVADEEARYKLEALLRGGEVQVDRGNLGLLVPAVQGLCQLPDAPEWASGLLQMLGALANEGAAYIMGRVRRP
jgi:hypothetical protein